MKIKYGQGRVKIFCYLSKNLSESFLEKMPVNISKNERLSKEILSPHCFISLNVVIW